MTKRNLSLIAILTIASNHAMAVGPSDDLAFEKPILVETTLSNRLLEKLIQEQLFSNQNLVDQLKSKKITVREKELSLSAVQLPSGAIEIGTAEDVASTITSVKVDKIWGIFGGGSGGAAARNFKLKFKIVKSSITTELDSKKSSNGQSDINLLRITMSLPSFTTSQVITSYSKKGGFLGIGSSSSNALLKLQLDDLVWTGTYQLIASRDADDGKKKLNLKFLNSKLVLANSSFEGSLVKGSPKTPQDALNVFKDEIHDVMEKAFSHLVLDSDDSINLGESDSRILGQTAEGKGSVTRSLVGLNVVRGTEIAGDDAKRSSVDHLRLSYKVKKSLGIENEVDVCAGELTYPLGPDPLREVSSAVLNSFPENSNSIATAIPFALLQNRIYSQARKGDFCKSLSVAGGTLSFYPVGAIRVSQAKDINLQPLNRIVLNLKLGYTYSNPLLSNLETSGELEIERFFKVTAEKDLEKPEIKAVYLTTLQDKVVGSNNAYSSAILESMKNISNRIRLFPPLSRIAGRAVVFAEATVTPSHLVIRSQRLAVNTVPADVRDSEIVDFACATGRDAEGNIIRGSNAGCIRSFTCPAGKRVVAARAACNLEFGVNSERHTVWNSLEVSRVSDRLNGACGIQKSQAKQWPTLPFSNILGSKNYIPWSNHIRSGFQQLDAVPGVFGESSFIYRCIESDENGGDCSIRGQAICR